MTTYNAMVTYVKTTEKTHKGVEYHFDTVEEATEWIAGKLSWLVMNWAKFDPNGIIVAAEVYNEEIGFSDLYELKCGL